MTEVWAAAGSQAGRPGPLLWILAIVWLALGLRCVQLCPRLWRDDPAFTSRVERVFAPLGPRWARAAIRMAPSAAVVLILSALLLFAGLVRDTAAGTVEDVANVAVTIVVWPFLFSIVSMWSVGILGRPQRFVPPARR